jgi:hypothetical protein
MGLMPIDASAGSAACKVGNVVVGMQNRLRLMYGIFIMQAYFARDSIFGIQNPSCVFNEASLNEDISISLCDTVKDTC